MASCRCARWTRPAFARSTFGRYDRAWGPARPIFGSVRYMSSDSAQKKLWLEHYLSRYGAQPSPLE
jgi:hypothetical protein